MTSVAAKATRLQALHAAPDLLLVVNVWDAVSARVVADVPGTQAPATASHSIAASHGYEDGEQIPRDEMTAAVGLIARVAGELPVTTDLEAGYGGTRTPPRCSPRPWSAAAPSSRKAPPASSCRAG